MTEAGLIYFGLAVFGIAGVAVVIGIINAVRDVLGVGRGNPYMRPAVTGNQDECADCSGFTAVCNPGYKSAEQRDAAQADAAAHENARRFDPVEFTPEFLQWYEKRKVRR